MNQYGFVPFICIITYETTSVFCSAKKENGVLWNFNIFVWYAVLRTLMLKSYSEHHYFIAGLNVYLHRNLLFFSSNFHEENFSVLPSKKDSFLLNCMYYADICMIFWFCDWCLRLLITSVYVILSDDADVLLIYNLNIL